MSAKKLIVLTAVVAALFAFIVLFERKLPTTADRQRKGDVYWDVPVDRVDRLELSRGDEKLEFQRVDAAKWKMVKPAKYPAEAFAVSGVVTELAALKQAGVENPDARPADYGLDKPVAAATFGWTDADDPKTHKSPGPSSSVRTFRAPTSWPRAQPGTPRVLFVPSSLLASVKKNVDEFLSKDVFGGSAADLARIDILRGRGRLVLVRKGGTWWLAEPRADLADAAGADRLAGQLTALRAREFVRGGIDLAAQGLNPPLFKVALTDSKGAVTTVDLGATRSDGNAMYAQRDGQVLLMDREIVDDLSKEADSFRSTALVDFNRSDVTSLEGAFGPKKFVLTQKDGGWSMDGHPILAAAADDVETAVLDAKSRAFLDDAAAKASRRCRRDGHGPFEGRRDLGPHLLPGCAGWCRERRSPAGPAPSRRIRRCRRAWRPRSKRPPRLRRRPSRPRRVRRPLEARRARRARREQPSALAPVGVASSASPSGAALSGPLRLRGRRSSSGAAGPSCPSPSSSSAWPRKKIVEM